MYLCKKYFTKLFIFLSVFFCFATNCYSEYSNEVESKKFNFKEIMKNTNYFEEFVRDNISTIKFNNKEEVATLLNNTTKGLFLNKYIKNSPFIEDFILKLSQSSNALPKLFSIFIERGKLIIFSIFIIVTIICSSFLGEFKYCFKIMSWERILFSFSRFTIINSIRLYGFLYLFKSHLSPTADIYLKTLALNKEYHPVLFKAHLLISLIF